MANLSSAFGQITIKAKSIEAIKNLIILQNEFEKTSCYETNLNSFHLNENELNKQIKEHSIQTVDDYFIYKDDFTATGRWSFESNVSWFLDSLESSDTDSEQIKQLKEKCQNEFYEIHFDINDEESGCQFIQSAIATIDYDPITKEKDYTYDVTTNYDYTVDNLIQLGFYNDGDILSANWLIDNYNNYFYDEGNKTDKLFIDNKTEIVDLLKKHPYKECVYYDLGDLIVDYKDLETFVNKNGYE